jgi:hypothetical protein
MASSVGVLTASAPARRLRPCCWLTTMLVMSCIRPLAGVASRLCRRRRPVKADADMYYTEQPLPAGRTGVSPTRPWGEAEAVTSSPPAVHCTLHTLYTAYTLQCTLRTVYTVYTAAPTSWLAALSGEVRLCPDVLSRLSLLRRQGRGSSWHLTASCRTFGHNCTLSLRLLPAGTPPGPASRGPETS